MYLPGGRVLRVAEEGRESSLATLATSTGGGGRAPESCGGLCSHLPVRWKTKHRTPLSCPRSRLTQSQVGTERTRIVQSRDLKKKKKTLYYKKRSCVWPFPDRVQKVEACGIRWGMTMKINNEV